MRSPMKLTLWLVAKVMYDRITDSIHLATQRLNEAHVFRRERIWKSSVSPDVYRLIHINATKPTSIDVTKKTSLV